MDPDRTLDIDAQIGQWRSFLDRHPAAVSADIDELEDHLRAQLADLTAVGLSEDEAFLVAVKRLGGVNARSREVRPPTSNRAQARDRVVFMRFLGCSCGFGRGRDGVH